MKKFIAVAIVSTVGLFGCAANTSAPGETVTLTQEVPAPQAQSKDEVYLNAVRGQNNSYVKAMSDRDILDIGSKVCPVLNSGVSVEEMVNALVTGLMSDGVSDPEAFRGVGVLVGGAIAVYCPEYSSQVEDL